MDQWTTPRRIFLVGGWTGPRRLAEGRRPTTPQWAGVVGEWGGDDDTYYKKENRVVQWSSPARPPRMAPQSGAIALSGDLRSPTSRPPPLVQCGPAWSSEVQGGPAGPGWSRLRGVGGRSPFTPEQCAIDAQDDSASIGRVRAGAACMQPGLSLVGRRPGHRFVSTFKYSRIGDPGGGQSTGPGSYE